MLIPQKYRLKNTIKYPTTIIVGGLNKLGLEIAESLMEQGGYVIIIDSLTKENIQNLEVFPEGSMISFLDYTSILHLEEDIRRLDYVFYFGHISQDFRQNISTQEFLTFSNYLDAILSLCTKFDARFLLTTSIKAHQVLFSEKDLLNGFAHDKLHSPYTEMELQKYAEGLTLEYHEKVKLNVRVTRLGEIIGDGMDFKSNSTFVDLILRAVKGQSLQLKNDGLENEWFAHVLDCSYGLIKALFSKDSNGKIFSLCYDTTYTHISIAYKIQELEENAKEIQFVNSKNTIPPLRINKPAPNLSQIGWMPRVSFDKAVIQSLAAAKIFLLENNVKSLGNSSNKDDKSIVNKVKSFLSLADSTNEKVFSPRSVEDLKANYNDSDALRKNRINLAGNEISKQKRKRAKSGYEKFQDVFWSLFTSFTNLFSFLKNKSPFEVGIFISLMILGVFLYFAVFSPMVVIARNALAIIPEYENLDEYWNNMEYDKFQESSENIKESLDEIKDILGRFEGVSKFLTLEDEYNETINLLNTYNLYLDGASDVGTALTPLSEYSYIYENNTQLRAGTDSFLSLAGPTTNYGEYLNDLDSKSPFLFTGTEKVKRAQSRLETINTAYLPSFLESRVNKFNEKLNTLEIQNLEGSQSYIPELLGNNRKVTYLVIAADNTRPTPIGGDMSAFALIGVEEGDITEVTVQSFNDVSFNLDSIDENELETINSRKFNLVTKERVTIFDLASISNYEDFSDSISQIFSDTFQRQVDSVVVMNLNTFEELTSNLNNENNIQVSNVEFDGEDFLLDLESTQTSNQNIQTKRKILAELLANLINRSLSNVGNLGIVYDSLKTSSESRNVLIQADSLRYQEYIREEDLNSMKINKTDSYVTVSMNLTDQKVVGLDRYPNINLAMETQITSSYNLINKLNVRFPSLGTTQEISLCFPISIDLNSINVTGVDQTRVVENLNDNEICTVVTVLTETEFNVEWNASNLFSSTSNNVNFNVGIGKVKGLTTNLDYKITLDSALQFNSEKMDIEPSGNTLIFTKELSKDEIIDIDLSR